MTHSAAAKIITLYEQHAEAWKRLRATDLFERPWLDRFLNLVPTNARLLDIGCGNGTPIAEYFIRQGFGVHSSLAPAEYRQLLNENGFRVVKMVFEDPECGGRTVWLAQSTI